MSSAVFTALLLFKFIFKRLCAVCFSSGFPAEAVRPE
nr:MAG TPA: hypothetical protein [Caudoviricetes sp.]